MPRLNTSYAYQSTLTRQGAVIPVLIAYENGKWCVRSQSSGELMASAKKIAALRSKVVLGRIIGALQQPPQTEPVSEPVTVPG